MLGGAHVVANRVESHEGDDQRAYGVKDYRERWTPSLIERCPCTN
jgi:hypothetical protein